MEVFSSSFFYPTSSLNNLTKKTLFKLKKSHFKSSPISPFPTTNSPILNPKNPCIISRFNRPKLRRNSLRKKLTGDSNNSQVIPKNPDFIDPQFNLDGEKVGNFENGGKNLGNSVMWDKLENWGELYKKEIDFWGIGSNPIFTVFQDSSNGKVDKVFVDESEILKRNGVDPLKFKDVGELEELEEFKEVNSKISHARFLARELECGRNVIDRNSSVAKFMFSGDGFGGISSVLVPKSVVVKVSKIGIGVVCGVLLIWVVKTWFGFGQEEVEMTSFEKEMLRRKMKARMAKEKETVEKCSVEVVEDERDSMDVVTKRPQFDKDAVLGEIRKAKGLSSDLVVVGGSGGGGDSSTMTDFRIKEIQMMARRAREIERGEGASSEGNDMVKENSIELKDKSSNSVDSVVFDDLERRPSTASSDMEKNVVEGLVEGRIINGISKTNFSESEETAVGNNKYSNEKASEGIGSTDSNQRTIIGDEIDQYDNSDKPKLTKRDLSDVSRSKMRTPMRTPLRRMPKIIRSVKEAREYLSLKNDKKAEVGLVSAVAPLADEGTGSYVSQRLGKDYKVPESSDIAVNVAQHEAVTEMKTDINMSNKELQIDVTPRRNPEMDKDFCVDTEQSLEIARDVDETLKHSTLETATRASIPRVNNNYSSLEWVDKVDDGTSTPTNSSEKSDVPSNVYSYDASNSRVSDTHDARVLDSVNLQETPHLVDLKGLDAGDGPAENPFSPTETNDHKNSDESYIESKFASDDTSFGSEGSSGNTDEKLVAKKESWLEKNFHEMEPIMDKMRSGFKDNFMLAREKVKQEGATTLDLMDLSSLDDDDTELEWMKDDKLREIVFKVRDNELAGRDPFDSMELEDKTAFFKGLESIVEKENQKLAILHEYLHSNIENIDYGIDGISIYDPPEKIKPRWKGPPVDNVPEFLENIVDKQKRSQILQNSNQSTKNDNTEKTQEPSVTKPTLNRKAAKFTKTVIEGSDGSIKPGKKSGKEHWEHTKKWSRGFLEAYNAETDPEVKATMKEIGKDLDRWVTEKEIEETGNLMDKLPQQGREFIEKKLNKLKREMELFGPGAVVSKYSEYSDQKEEDYLWWLDLPHVLCLEMYILEGEDQEVGFYTLEMAEDLELDPKPQHLIAFQDAGDCKNFCYIMQAHLEMLNKGHAFVVAQHPKDVYLQAKETGFGVTVIRKGEIKLNVDQQLEEVEELISEIGTKMYHDKIMKERSVDISSLMKGVFGFNPMKRRRRKQALKRPKKP